MSRADSPDKHDEAWLLARERGEAAEHPDPERARGYERLERALAQPPPREPPADFEADLFAALERAERRQAAPDAAPRGEPRQAEPVAAAAPVVDVAPVAPVVDVAPAAPVAPVVDAAPVAPVVNAAPAAVVKPAAPAAVVKPAAPVADPANDGRARVRRLRAYALTPLAAAAAALLAWGLAGPSGGAPALALQVVAGERVRGEPPPDSGGAARGDRLRVRASFEGAGELRVYREGSELVLRCPGGPACDEAPEGAGRSVRGEVSLVPGRYEALLFTGAAVPPPTGRLEDDVRAARAAGAKVSIERPLLVR